MALPGPESPKAWLLSVQVATNFPLASAVTAGSDCELLVIALTRNSIPHGVGVAMTIPLQGWRPAHGSADEVSEALSDAGGVRCGLARPIARTAATIRGAIGCVRNAIRMKQFAP